ncbi:MAG: hypothetical protein II388_04400 [Clostridia bacterium]|nr:hypothetical protein [Clostridia bacterium]
MKTYRILVTALTATVDTIIDLVKEPTVSNYYDVCMYIIETAEKDWGLDIKPLETRLYSIRGVKSIESKITVIYPSFGGGYREIKLTVWLNGEEIGWDFVQ